jgi:cell division transport system permease protein
MRQALQYFFSEAATSLWRRRRGAILAVLTIASGLFILGLFLLITTNGGRLVQGWTDAAELSVFLRDDVTSEQLGAIEDAVDRSGLAARREYISKDEARRRFRRDYRDLAVAADTLEVNPFPASVEVRLLAENTNGEAVDALVTKLATTPGVADVRFDRRWMQRLLGVLALVRGAGVFLVAVLAVAAALTVANVVRLATYARRDEIEIMQLVGAPAAYVRGPFIAEGVIQGGIGAIIGLLSLWVVFAVMNARYGRMASESLGLESLSFLPVGLTISILAGGMALGCLGGLVASRSVRTW